MEKIRFEQRYYNGCILPYATVYDAIEFEIIKGNVYIIVEREHYFSSGYNTNLIRGKALMSDVVNDFSDIQFISELENISRDVKQNYKQDFFIDEIPYALSYKIINIDGEEYKFSSDVDDLTYKYACDDIDKFCNMISLPTKLLGMLLSNKPFEKC